MYLDTQLINWDKNQAMVSVQFTPTGDLLTVYYTNLKQQINIKNQTIKEIRIVVFNKDSNIYSHSFTSGVSTGYTNIISIAGLTYDQNYTLDVYVFVLTSGNVWVQAKTVYFWETKFNYIQILQSGLRSDFGCSANNNDSCLPLLLIALFITMTATGALGMNLGGFRADYLVFIALAIFGVFTYLWWIPAWLYVVMCMAGAFMVFMQWRLT